MARILFCTLLSAFLWVSGVQAAETEQGGNAPETDKVVQALLDAPEGVFDVELNANGTINRLKIKATIEVSTSLRGARADRLARESAMRNARAAFATYMKSNVVFVESGTEGTQIVEKDKVESGTFTQASASSVNVATQAFQQGLITILQRFEGEGVNRSCTVVLGWSQKQVKAAQSAQEAMSPQKNDAASAKSSAPATAPVEEKRGTSTKTGDMDF